MVCHSEDVGGWRRRYLHAWPRVYADVTRLASPRNDAIRGIGPLAGVAATVPVCIALAGCGDSGSGDALRDARERTLSAPYLTVTSDGGRRVLLLSRGLTVIKSRRRVLTWVTPAFEWSWWDTRRCYERHTEFERDDVLEQREGVVPRELGDVRVEASDGGRLISGRARLPQPSDTADTEFRMRIDGTERVVEVRRRSARFGVIPPGRWYTTVLRYPSAAEFAEQAGRPPRPRCRP